MGTDDEKSEDEEEILVYVEFEGLVDSNVFSDEQLQLDMIGIDTEHPIMQINGRFYEGTYEDVLGTYMFFTKNENSMVDDPVFDATSNLKYFAKTRKFLRMQRIFIKSRTEVLGDSEDSRCIPNINTLKQAGVPLQYQQEALSFWETMRNNRLNALHVYLEKQRIRQEKKSQGITVESESDEDHPFAMYKQKQEETNKSRDNAVVEEKESCNCENKLKPLMQDSKKTVNEILHITEDNCQNNLKKLPTSEPEPSSSNTDDYYSARSIKTCKANTSTKKSARVVCKTQRVKSKKRQRSVKDTDSLPVIKGKEISSAKKNLEETLNSVEIAINKNEKINNDNETTIIRKGKEDASVTDSADNKITKQLKREAKMKEISEQLKAIAEERLNKKIK